MCVRVKVSQNAPKRKGWVWLLISLALGALVTLVLALGAFVLWGVGGLSGTSLDRGDFPTETEAREFVNGHLPTPLPSNAKVTALTYERFTDWHLTTSILFPSQIEARAFLTKAHGARTTNEGYCGPDADAQVSYFIPEYYACGRITEPTANGMLEVTCNTR